MANRSQHLAFRAFVSRTVRQAHTFVAPASGGEDEMHYAVLQPKGPLTAVASNIAALRFPFTGKIREVRVYCAASSISVVEAVFDINAGPSPGSIISIFTNPSARPKIAPGQLQGSVTGLDVNVAQDWFCSVDLDSVPPGGVSGPVFVALVLEKTP